jgi:hypothetical protein
MYKTMLKPVVVYGCETWSVTAKDKYVGEGRIEVGV